MKKLIAVLAGVLLLLPSLTMALEPFNKDLRYGMTKNAEVKRMQEFLRDEGLYKGAITGNYYTLTRDAVRKYQKNNGLKVTGLFDKVTRSKVNEGVVVSEEVSPTPVVDSSPSIPVGWIVNGDGTWRAPEENRTVVTNIPSSIGYCSNCGFGTLPIDKQVDTLQRQVLDLQNQIENKKSEQTSNSALQQSNPILNNPSVTISRKNLYDNDELEIIALNDDFVIEAFTIVGSGKEVREKIVLNNYTIYNSENEEKLYKNILTSAYKFDNLGECQSINSNFKEFSNKEYPYSCTGKNYTIEQNQNKELPLGYTFSSIDWMGRKRSEVIAEQSRRSAIFIPKLTTIEYMKFVGKNSGKVFEFRNI